MVEKPGGTGLEDNPVEKLGFFSPPHACMTIGQSNGSMTSASTSPRLIGVDQLRLVVFVPASAQRLVYLRED